MNEDIDLRNQLANEPLPFGVFEVDPNRPLTAVTVGKE